MRLPNPKYQSYKIALYLHQSGGATKVEAVKHFDGMGPQRVRDAINDMFGSEMLSRDGDVYRCKPYLSRYFDDCERVVSEPAQVAAPADASLKNKPWSGKYSFSNAPRREEIRKDMSFINGSIGFSAGYRL